MIWVAKKRPVHLHRSVNKVHYRALTVARDISIGMSSSRYDEVEKASSFYSRRMWNTSKLTIMIANTSKRTSEISDARSLVANPTASTENKILTVTSLAVIRMPQGNVDSISVNSQDANTPKLDSREKIIVRDTCDAIIILPNNHQDDFAEPAVPADERLNAIKGLEIETKSSRFPQDSVRIRDCPVQNVYYTLRHAPSVETTKIQEYLSLSENREICAMDWADECSLKWRLNNSVHLHGQCRCSEPSPMLSYYGSEQRRLRVKDWQNAHGKVGGIGCQFHLRSKKTTEAMFSAFPGLDWSPSR